MKKVRFGIVGAGNIADVHTKSLAAASNAEPVVVYDTVRERAAALAARHGIRAAGTLEELLAADIEAVTIATPSGLHSEAAVAAAKAGKHILCEKPLEVTVEKADRILRACEAGGVLLATVFQMRFTAAAQRMKRTVEEGRFGVPVFANAAVHWFRPKSYYAQATWRGTWALDGGGALMNQGIHTVDLLLHFAGAVAEVDARAMRRVHEAIEVEDTVAALIRFRSGAFGSLQASTACAPGFPVRIELLGTAGSAVMEDDRIVRWQFAEERPEDEEIRRQGAAGEGLASGSSNPTAIQAEGHRRQIEELAAAIRTGAKLSATGVEGRRAVELVCAVYEAARSGKTVLLS